MIRTSSYRLLFKTASATLVVLIGAVVLAFAAEQGDRKPSWVAPEAARTRVNPLPSSDEVLREGLKLYKKNCLTCHGTEGKGDGPATQFIESTPTDLSQPEVQSRLTEGEIFWKLTEGRNPMPSFKKKLSETERWHLARYVRSLNTLTR
jgi:mono/diheme cytochrome c family protein